jgi:exonuclease III
MKYVSWNCRGLGNKLKEEALKDIIRMTMPEILLIQETKLEEPDLLRASKFFGKKAKGKRSVPEEPQGELTHSGTAPNWI